MLRKIHQRLSSSFFGTAFLSVLLLVGCAGIKNNPQQAAALLCTTGASALQVLTVFKAKLTSTEIEIVDRAVNVMYPLCSSSTPPENITDAQVKLLQGAVDALSGLRDKVTPKTSEVQRGPYYFSAAVWYGGGTDYKSLGYQGRSGPGNLAANFGAIPNRSQ